MARVMHKLTHLDTQIQEAVCSSCGPVSIKKNGHDSSGKQQWKCSGTLETKDHRLLDVDFEERTAWCKGCQRRIDFIGTGAARIKCGPDSRRRATERRTAKADLIRETHSEWRKKNSGRLKDAHYRRTFGLSFEQVKEKFHEQGGRCAICRRGISLLNGSPREMRANLDHHHETGLVRSLLCHHCNAGLGSFFDSPEILEAAAEYLRRHSS